MGRTSKEMREVAYAWDEGVCGMGRHGLAFVDSAARSFKYLLLDVLVGCMNHGLKAAGRWFGTASSKA